MLYIKNRENLKDQMVLRNTTDGYYIEGVYQYEDHYQIHIRSNDSKVWDELLILQRNKVKNQNNDVYNYYTLYNSNEPQRRQNITKAQIQWKDMFLHNIELILQMNN